MKKLLPRFSVVIPCFNNAMTLERAINSVLSQTVPAHEVIVIDDGSTDNSSEIAESFENKIRYFKQSNQGVSMARNSGVKFATGDWIAFLDADDEYSPNRIEAHLKWIVDEPDLDFLLADQESRTPDGDFIEAFMEKSEAGRRLLHSNKDANRILIGVNDFEYMIKDGFAEIRTVSLPRKKFFEIGGFLPHHKIGEDLHFFIRLFANSAKVGIVPSVLSIYYIYPQSVLRKDPLNAMKLFVSTVESLRNDMHNVQPAVRRGLEEKCRQNRLSLAYAFLRVGDRKNAIASVLPSFYRKPSLATFRDIISICRGFSNVVPK